MVKQCFSNLQKLQSKIVIKITLRIKNKNNKQKL